MVFALAAVGALLGREYFLERNWDPDARAIADAVEDGRGRTFGRPVDMQFMEGPAFVGRVYEVLFSGSRGEDMVGAARAMGLLQGEYDSLAMGRGLSQERLQRYFDAKGGGRFAVKAPIRSRVEFRALNLLDSYASLGKFDIVFCRNVLIYFSADVKREILLRIHATLKPGGYLFLGASEALNGLPDHYQMVQCSPGIIYKAK